MPFKHWLPMGAMMIPAIFKNKSILLASAICAVVVVAAIASSLGPKNDAASLAKKEALELNKFSAAQLPMAASCYDNILVATPGLEPELAARACKCLISEVDKFATDVRPALRNLVLIGLEASAQTSDKSDRNELVRAAIVKDETLTSLPKEKHPVLQSGIRSVTRSCPVPTA